MTKSRKSPYETVQDTTERWEQQTLFVSLVGTERCRCKDQIDASLHHVTRLHCWCMRPQHTHSLHLHRTQKQRVCTSFDRAFTDTTEQCQGLAKPKDTFPPRTIFVELTAGSNARATNERMNERQFFSRETGDDSAG